MILGDAWDVCHPLTDGNVIVLSRFLPSTGMRLRTCSAGRTEEPERLFLAQMVRAGVPTSLHSTIPHHSYSNACVVHMVHNEYLSIPQSGAPSTLSMVANAFQGPVSLLSG